MSEITAKGLPGQDCKVSFNWQAKRSHSKKLHVSYYYLTQEDLTSIF